MMMKTWRVVTGVVAAVVVAGSAFAQTVTTLENNQVVRGLAAPRGQALLFKVAVPEGQTQFAVGTDGGYGDCDLYVRRGAAPTLTAFDYHPVRAGNREYVSVSNPQAGDWYIMAYARYAFSSMLMGVAFQPGTAPTPRVATPVFTPAGGAFVDEVSVTIACATADAAICYTTDGTEPTAASTAYAGAIPLTATTTLRARAFKDGMADSAIATATFTIGAAPEVPDATVLRSGELVRVSAPTGEGRLFKINVPVGQTQLAVTSADGTGDADLYIRFGAAPTLTSYDYRPYRPGNREYIGIANPQTGDWYIMAYARSSFANLALAAICTPGVPVTPRVATPVFSPAGGSFAASVNVTISCSTAGAAITYTTDGTEPTAASTAYAGAIPLTATKTLRAKAFKDGLADSYPATAAFTIGSGGTGGGGTGGGTVTIPPVSAGHGVDIDRFSWTPTSAPGAATITGILTVPVRWPYRFIGMSGNYSTDFLGKLNPRANGVYTVSIPRRSTLILQLPTSVCPDPARPRQCIVLEYSFNPNAACSYRGARTVHYSYRTVYSPLRDWRWQQRGSAAPNWNAYLLLP